jgi:lipopolysaccharide/colanic/teichoic acid biosynthesis glycosyltransferase
MKNYFDRTAALALIIFLSPVFIISALAVKLTSSGPFLFKQKRRGVNGDSFDCYKFRSMIVDQNNIASDSNIEFEPAGMLIKIKDDPRVTSIGKMLRKTSLDELPQLFNVLKGDMSFVGPRPLPLYNIDPHPEFRQLRCLVKPGITGIWQISARSNQNLTALSMQPYDLEYIRRFSLLLDLKILLKTIPAVLSGKGAE